MSCVWWLSEFPLFLFLHVSSVTQASIQTSSVRSLQYGFWSYILGERTTPRLQKFSKIITVDGNLASGKGALAQKLADSLGNDLLPVHSAAVSHISASEEVFCVSTGMLYMPEADSFYLDKMTGEKESLPQDYNGMCSLEKFYLEPKAADGNSYRLQLWMYLMRLLQYSDAIEHLLTTGPAGKLTFHQLQESFC